MEMTITSTCSICGVKGDMRNGLFFPGYRLPDPQNVDHYMPPDWQYIAGVTLCPLHSYRIVIERVRPRHSPFIIEIEHEPGARAQPLQWREEEA